MKLIELYRFVLDTEIWTYTSGDESIDYNGETYAPVAMGRSKTEVQNELSKASIDVTIDVRDDLAQRMLTTFTEKVLGLTLYTQDQETATTTIGWKGRLSSVRPEKNKLTLTFESVFTSLRRPGLRARYQKTCRYVLYGRGCNLDPEDFADAGEVTAVSGAVVTVPEAAAQTDGYYIGGMLKTPSGIYGFIIDHVGTTITLQRQIDSLVQEKTNSGYGLNYGNLYGGVGVSLYPGCDRLRSTCKDKFNNLPRFGGFPWIPSRNPMDGSSIM